MSVFFPNSQITQKEQVTDFNFAGKLVTVSASRTGGYGVAITAETLQDTIAAIMEFMTL